MPKKSKINDKIVKIEESFSLSSKIFSSWKVANWFVAVAGSFIAAFIVINCT